MTRPALKIRPVTTKRFIWRGIVISVRHTYTRHGRWYGQHETGDHIAVTVIGPDADLCPFANGYRSFVVSTRKLRMTGGPIAHVARTLDAAANEPAWRKAEFRRRQGDLFE